MVPCDTTFWTSDNCANLRYLNAKQIVYLAVPEVFTFKNSSGPRIVELQKVCEPLAYTVLGL